MQKDSILVNIQISELNSRNEFENQVNSLISHFRFEPEVVLKLMNISPKHFFFKFQILRVFKAFEIHYSEKLISKLIFK